MEDTNAEKELGESMVSPPPAGTPSDLALDAEIARFDEEAKKHFGPPAPLPDKEAFDKIVPFIHTCVAQFATVEYDATVGPRKVCKFSMFVETEGRSRLRKPFPECMDAFRVWFEEWEKTLEHVYKTQSLTISNKAAAYFKDQINVYLKHIQTQWQVLHTRSVMMSAQSGWIIVYQIE